MELIKKFAEKILVEKVKGSFDIEQSGAFGRKIHFLQDNVGDAVFMYAMYGDEMNMKKRSRRDRYSSNVVAVISSEKIYIVDKFLFDLRSPDVNPDELPEGVFLFDDIVEKYNEYANNVLFKGFYDKLPLIEPESPENCIEEARRIIFYGERNKKLMNLFDEDDLGEVLSANISVDEIVNKKLEKDVSSYIKDKARKERIKSLIESGDAVEDYEKEILDALRAADAITVNVKFRFKGMEEVEKIESDKLIRRMYNRDGFGCFDFTTEKRGKDLLAKLGVDRYSNDLTAKNIVEIKYKGKVIYEAKEI